MWNLRFHCARRWQRHSNSFDHRPNFDLQTLLYLKPKTNIIPMSLKAPLLKKYKLKIWAWITTHIHCSMWYENTLLHPKFRDGLVSKCMIDWLFFFLHIIGIFRWHMQFNKRISLIRMTYIDKSDYIYIYDSTGDVLTHPSSIFDNKLSRLWLWTNVSFRMKCGKRCLKNSRDYIYVVWFWNWMSSIKKRIIVSLSIHLGN